MFVHVSAAAEGGIPVTINIPPPVADILSRLEACGFAAYAVGGCVRDSLLGNAPQDWDICTSAEPAEISVCFSDCRILETGLRHGTVTVMTGGVPYEITTFRVEGAYSDRRRPDSVVFVKSLREDLARRDFTVNAMAARRDGTVLDPFGGRADLRSRLVRCVGQPEARFGEDALRILRAIRFSAVLDFEIETGTAAAIHENLGLLSALAAELITAELMKTLTGQGIRRVLIDFFDVFGAVLPCLAGVLGKGESARKTWGNKADAIACAARDPAIRLALLLQGDDAVTALRRLRLDRMMAARVENMLLWQQEIPEEAGEIRRLICRLGPDCFFDILTHKKAECVPRGSVAAANRLAALARVEQYAREALAGGNCLSLRQLALNGREILSLGVPEGPRVGALLTALLDGVLEGRLPNERDVLLAEARRMIAGGAFSKL